MGINIGAIMVLGIAAGALVSFGVAVGLDMLPPIGVMPWLILGAVTVIALAAVLLLKKKGQAKGQPWEDERSKKIKALAGYYSYMTSLYYILGFMLFGGVMDERILARHMVVIIMLGMAFFFAAFYLYFSRQADVELPE